MLAFLLHDTVEEMVKQAIDQIANFKQLNESEKERIGNSKQEEAFAEIREALKGVMDSAKLEQEITLIDLLTKRFNESDEMYLHRLFGQHAPIFLLAQAIKLIDRVDNFSNPRLDKPLGVLRKKIERTNILIFHSQLPQQLKDIYFNMLRSYYPVIYQQMPFTVPSVGPILRFVP